MTSKGRSWFLPDSGDGTGSNRGTKVHFIERDSEIFSSLSPNELDMLQRLPVRQGPRTRRMVESFARNWLASSMSRCMSPDWMVDVWSNRSLMSCVSR